MMKNIVTGLMCASIVSAGMFFSACTPPPGRGVEAIEPAVLEHSPIASVKAEQDTSQWGNDEDVSLFM